MVTQASVMKFPVDLAQHNVSAISKRTFITKQALLPHHTAHQMFEPYSNERGRCAMPGHVCQIKCQVSFFNMRVIDKVTAQKQGRYYRVRCGITVICCKSGRHEAALDPAPSYLIPLKNP